MTGGATAVAAIRRAAPGDLAGIERLLVASHLTTEGVADALRGFFVAEHDGELVGVVGVEECCEYGLLRSTAVSPEWPNTPWEISMTVLAESAAFCARASALA